MFDVLRFRVARSPQRREPDPDRFVPLYLGEQDSAEFLSAALEAPDRASLVQAARQYLESDQFIDPFAAGDRLLVNIDRWLTAHRNRVQPESLLGMLGASDESGGSAGDEAPTPRINDDEWVSFRRSVADSMIAAMIAGDVVRSDRLHRLIIVAAVCEDLVSRRQRYQTEDDVEQALDERSAVFPPGLSLRNAEAESLRSVLARRPGFADLYVVREEWNRYVAGEIADIQNILSGEIREAELTRVNEREEITTEERERSTFEERDNQSTERFELSDEASRESSLQLQLEGSVDTSGQYGPTRVETHIGGSLDLSVSESQRRSVNTAREVTSRAVARVQERIREARIIRTLARTTDRTKHVFDNSDGAGTNVSGIYRWVDKILRLRTFFYPHRFLLEFELPEPGAWVRWALAPQSPGDLITERPPALLDGSGQALTPSLITAANYAQLAATFRAEGINPPPGPQVVGIAISRDSPNDPPQESSRVRHTSNATLAIPTGYAAATWQASIMSWVTGALSQDGDGQVAIAVGDSAAQALYMSNYGAGETQLNGNVGGTTTGSVPISVRTDDVYGYTINVQVTCNPTAAAIDEWRAETFERIAAGYRAWKREYDEELASLRLRQPPEYGVSPAAAERMVQQDLRRQVIGFLRGSNVSGFDAVELKTRADTTLLFRLLGTSGDHFYTMSAAERDNAVVNLGYVSEGVACEVFPAPQAGTTPLFRLFGTNGDHFYTMSAAERDNAVANLGYVSEGVACEVFPAPQAGTTPLFRLFGTNGDHFYTTSAAERDNAVANLGYVSEGVACEVLPAGAEQPFPDLTEASRIAPEIQFLEQAFEWENLSYVAYPYYWGRNTSEQWRDLVSTATADARFDEFLRSGSARVLVPARPGFESAVQLYVATGILWGGSQAPAPDEPGYLSVADEIKALQRASGDDCPVGDAWEIRLPTTLVWLSPDTQLPLENPEATFPDPPDTVTCPE